MSASFNEEQLAGWRAVFKAWDRDRDGALDRAGLIGALSEMGLSPSEAEVNALFVVARATNAGRLEEADFLALATKLIQGVALGKKVRFAFRVFDRDRDGVISRSEFVRAAVALGLGADTDELNAAFDDADLDRNGQIDGVDFARMILPDGFGSP